MLTEDRWAIDQQETTRVVMEEAIGGSIINTKCEEAIGSMPKGLKNGSAACRWKYRRRTIRSVNKVRRIVAEEGLSQLIRRIEATWVAVDQRRIRESVPDRQIRRRRSVCLVDRIIKKRKELVCRVCDVGRRLECVSVEKKDPCVGLTREFRHVLPMTMNE